MPSTRDMRFYCASTLQMFWFRKKELKDVLDAYEIRHGDACHDTMAKLLLKTRKDFINGFSFFTREDIDTKIMKIIGRYENRCMNR